MRKILSYEVDGKKLKVLGISSHRDIVFDFPIGQVLMIMQRILVRLKPDIGEICNENVFCVTLDDGIICQVEKVKKFHDASPYTNVVIENGRLFFYSRDGQRMEVNLKDGKIISRVLTK